MITSYLHADNLIKQLSANRFEFEPNKTSLLVELVSPQHTIAKIEKNFLTAPGRPGSVDKGEREERGVRLAFSTGKKTNKATFKVKIKIQK